MTNEETLGELLRRRRGELDISQTELGRRIGADRSYVSQIETGGRKWPAAYIDALVRELGVPYNVLVDAAAVDRKRARAGDAPAPDPNGNAGDRAELAAIVSGLVRDEDVATLLRVARLMPWRRP